MLNRMSTLRPTALLLLVLLFSAALVSDASADSLQGADDAKHGEDQLDELLRRFGPEHAGLADRIEEAIRKGTAWLLDRQRADGGFPCFESTAFGLGGSALCTLALKKSMAGLYDGTQRDLDREVKKLATRKRSGRITWEESQRLEYLESKAPAELVLRARLQAAVEKGIDYVRGVYQKQQADGTPGNTYDYGVVLMLLEAQYVERQKTRDGYAFRVDRRRMPAADLAWIREMVAYLESKVSQPVQDGKTWNGRAWRYPSPGGTESNIDNSNTQYAVLGLKAASRMDVHLSDQKVWVDVAKYFVGCQQPDGPPIPRPRVGQNSNDGRYVFLPPPTEAAQVDRARGWSYYPAPTSTHPVTGAMTTAGLAALIVAKSELAEANAFRIEKDLEEQIDRALTDGMAWLGRHFTVAGNPREGGTFNGYHLYFLYGLERAGVLCQAEFFGKHAWYPTGAKFLCDTQDADGHWKTDAPASCSAEDQQLTDTCFALLFLKRATVPVNVPPVVKPEITGSDAPDNDGDEGNN